jgi:hypothetical protein
VDFFLEREKSLDFFETRGRGWEVEVGDMRGGTGGRRDWGGLSSTEWSREGPYVLPRVEVDGFRSTLVNVGAGRRRVGVLSTDARSRSEASSKA